jgi:hypothetical protein
MVRCHVLHNDSKSSLTKLRVWRTVRAIKGSNGGDPIIIAWRLGRTQVDCLVWEALPSDQDILSIHN